jgi:type IV pilus assembly protein PilW
MILIKTKQSQGFSLVELMVAMVIGLIIVSGAFSMNNSTRKTQVKSEEQMDMVADARFAIEMIAYDLRQAGSWGGTNKDGLISCRSTDSACVAPPTAGNDCALAGSPVWAFNLSQPVFATDAANPYATTCIPTSTEEYLAGTDVLDIRYADSNIVATANLRAGQAYVRSNFINGQVFVGATPPTLSSYESSALTANHELHAYAYYISSFTDVSGDGIPSLRRVSLVNGPAVQAQVLVSGVADLQVQFGVDTTGDGIVNRYDPPATVTADNNWFNVYAAKIWLLMRTDKKQKGINTAKSFDIAGATVTKGGQDDYRYFMVSSVVDMRNLKQL